MCFSHLAATLYTTTFRSLSSITLQVAVQIGLRVFAGHLVSVFEIRLVLVVVLHLPQGLTNTLVTNHYRTSSRIALVSLLHSNEYIL